MPIHTCVHCQGIYLGSVHSVSWIPPITLIAGKTKMMDSFCPSLQKVLSDFCLKVILIGQSTAQVSGKLFKVARLYNYPLSCIFKEYFYGVIFDPKPSKTKFKLDNLSISCVSVVYARKLRCNIKYLLHNRICLQ